MKHILATSAHLAELTANPGMAWIDADATHMMVVIDGDLHVLVGDLSHVQTDEDVNNFIHDHFAK